MVQVGSILWDEFRVEAFIAGGGMAEVYKVRDANDNFYAAKLIREDRLIGANATEYKAYFRNEVELHRQLDHPNIVRFLASYDKPLGILLEYVPGDPLNHLINAREGKAIEPDEILTICKQIASALDYLHKRQICHCDIKPANILFDNDGNYKLTDFGISQFFGSYTTSGTSYYMAPEQITADQVGVPTDLYPFAITTYEMLTGGERPFTDRTDQAANTAQSSEAIPLTLHEQHLYENPPPPSQFNHDISVETDAVILKALSKEMASRYQSGAHFVNDLETALKPSFGSRLAEMLPGGKTRGTISLPSAQLVCTKGSLKGTTIPINHYSLLIGRSAECDIVIPDNKQVSRRHVLLTWSEQARGGGAYYLQDQYSTYKTRVNGRRHNACRLNHLDLISIVGNNFRFEVRET